MNEQLEKSLTPGSLLITGLGSEAEYLPRDANGKVLSLVNGLPVWVTLAINSAIRSVSASTTLTDLDHTVIVSAGGIVITLPSPVGRTGKIFIIKNLSASAITLSSGTSALLRQTSAAPTTTISLAATAAGGSIQVQSNGIQWITIASGG